MKNFESHIETLKDTNNGDVIENIECLSAPSENIKVNRRGFLKAAGLVIGAMAVEGIIGKKARGQDKIESKEDSAELEFNMFFDNIRACLGTEVRELIKVSKTEIFVVTEKAGQKGFMISLDECKKLNQDMAEPTKNMRALPERLAQRLSVMGRHATEDETKNAENEWKKINKNNNINPKNFFIVKEGEKNYIVVKLSGVRDYYKMEIGEAMQDNDMGPLLIEMLETNKKVKDGLEAVGKKFDGTKTGLDDINKLNPEVIKNGKDTIKNILKLKNGGFAIRRSVEKDGNLNWEYIKFLPRE